MCTTANIMFLCAVAIATSTAQICGEDRTVQEMKKPIYDFSVRFLYRISYGVSDHFVYSPLATWLQLVTIADGAQKGTRHELWHVTGLKGIRKRSCYRRKLKEILNNMERDTDTFKRSSVVIIDKLFKVKKLFKRKVEALHNTKVLSLKFDDEEKSADKVNNFINEGENRLPDTPDVVNPEDFEGTVLLTADLTHFKSAWKYSFNKAQTKPVLFYSGNKIVDVVDMMNQVGYFKEVEIPLIGARVLELPFENERMSMLIYLPIKDTISDVFYSLKFTTLSGVLNMLNIEEPKAVNVSLPKFKIETEISNIPELLYDMGVKKVFYPEIAELGEITDSGDINISSMKQVSIIDVTESHVEANVIAESIISDATTDFNANKPFAFMLVDKKTEIILFAGMYSGVKNNVSNDVQK